MGRSLGPDRAVDPRVFPILREWAALVVVATGKAFLFPIALCDFLGIELCVVAENGGVVFVGQTDALTMTGDPEAANAVAEAYRERGHDLGWGRLDFPTAGVRRNSRSVATARWNPCRTRDGARAGGRGHGVRLPRRRPTSTRGLASESSPTNWTARPTTSRRRRLGERRADLRTRW